MQPLNFNYRDLFRAPRMAFSLQRIWIQFLGLSFGYVFYLIATYVAFILNGNSFNDVWQDFGLLPCLFAFSDSIAWYGWIVYGLGIVVLLAAFLLTNTAVARAAYMVTKGNHFYSWREAFTFSFRKSSSVLLTSFAIFILIACMVFGTFLLGLLGQIPYLGEIAIALFALVWFISALLMIYLFLACLTSLLLTPSIIATTDEDAFEVVFQTFSITWSQPWRLLIYEILIIFITVASFTILAFFGKRAVMLTNYFLCSFMGLDYITLSKNGLSLVQNSTAVADSIIHSVFHGFSDQIFFANKFIYHSTSNMALSGASYLYAFSLLCFGGWILSYGLSTFTIGHTLAYLVLRQKKDGENLLERKDKEEEDEENESPQTIIKNDSEK